MPEWLRKLVAKIIELLSKIKVNPTPEPKPADTLTVQPGVRVEQGLSVPCSLKFTITGKAVGSPEREECIAWAVEEGKDWNGGNANYFVVNWRDYDQGRCKLKAYGTDGQVREALMTHAWFPGKSYKVEVGIGDGVVSWKVTLDQNLVAQCSIQLPTPKRVTMGYGWPPSKRNGAQGSTISGVLWVDEEEVEVPTGGDELDPAQVAWDGPLSPASWPITARLSNVSIDSKFIRAIRTPATGWDSVQEPGWDQPAIGNWWIFGKFEGKWRATTIEWLGPAKSACERKPTFPPGSDDIRGPLGISWYPGSGEMVGIMQSSFGGRDGKTRGTKPQRTNIVLVRWP